MNRRIYAVITAVIILFNANSLLSQVDSRETIKIKAKIQLILETATTKIANINRHSTISSRKTINTGRIFSQTQIDEVVTEEIDITLDGRPGMRITVNHKFGDIEIIRGSNDKITLKGEKRVTADDRRRAEDFLEKIRLEIDESSNRVAIRANYPNNINTDRERINSFSITYILEIPENINLDVTNSFGDTELLNLSGDIRVSNSMGLLVAENLSGEIELSNRFGSVTAFNLTGSSEITNQNGSLDIRKVTGNLRAESRFGSIEVDEVSGTANITGGNGSMKVERIGSNLTLQNSFGTITVIDVGGRTVINGRNSNVRIENIRDELNVTTSFGTIECTDITGETEIRNQNGRITVRNIGSSVRINNSFGRVEAIDINGDLTVDNKNSSVDADGITGDVDIRNSFSGVTITDVGGNIRVINGNGAITVRDILQGDSQDEKTIDLETSFGRIEIELPRNVSARLEALTSFGTIRNDFEGEVETIGFNNHRLSTEIGTGRHTIRLQGKNSNILIRKR